jgi:hypothetical protein
MGKTYPSLRDAGKVFLFLSEKYEENPELKMRCGDIAREIGWDFKRVKRAVGQLHNGFIKPVKTRWIETGDFMVSGLTSSAKRLLEDEEEFREYFGL